MSKKTKIEPCIVTSREALESTVADVVKLKLESAALKTAMEQEIAAVQDKHKAAILSVNRQISVKEAGVFIYCQSNKRTLFPQKKSIDTLLAIVGFRTNPPSVEKVKGIGWDDVALRLASTDWGRDYLVEPEPEVSKSKILADREKLTAEQLAEAGLKIEQEDQFFITPKSDIAEPTVQQAA